METEGAFGRRAHENDPTIAERQSVKLDIRIPLMDLKRQYQSIKGEIDKAVKEILSSQRFVLGDRLKTFEKCLASYCGVPYAVGVNSGTDALFLALRALDIKRGDDVITTPFTFIATAEAIVNTGARPVFVDIDRDTYNIDPDKIVARIAKRTKAILPVHLYGQCAPMEKIRKIANAHKLKIVEDAAQAIGEERFTKKVGSFGDVAGFSFYPGKNLGCFGDGGLITTRYKNIRDKVLLLRNHGSSPNKKYSNTVVGFNSRLDNLQAAVLKVKLKYLKSWIKKRRQNAKFYSAHLHSLPLEVPHVAPGNLHTFHQYTARTEKRDDLIEYLLKNGIEARVYYPVPLHLQKSLRFLGYRKGDFPCAEEASRKVFSIPIHENLSRTEKHFIVEKVKEFFKTQMIADGKHR